MKKFIPADPAPSRWLDGFPTFMRCPHTLANVNLAVRGIPCDGSTTYRSSAKFRSKATRYYSFIVKTYNQFLIVDVFHTLNIVDYWDIDIDLMSIDCTYEIVDIKWRAVLVCEEFFAVRGQMVYVSLDTDVVNPSFAPDTCFPEVGGIISHGIITTVRCLFGLDMFSFDKAELLSANVRDYITSLLARHLLFVFLSVLALRRKGG